MARTNPAPKPAPHRESTAGNAAGNGSGTVTDLFGDPVVPAQRKRSARAESDDMDLVRSVIATAIRDGYAVTGHAPRVHRLVGMDVIEPVPAYEAAMVTQLLDRKWLSEGGRHRYTARDWEGYGRAVLVPKSTRAKAAQWDALTPLPNTRAGHIRDASTGRPARSRNRPRNRVTGVDADGLITGHIELPGGLPPEDTE